MTRIGVALQVPDAATAVALIVDAEAAGVPAAWLTTGGVQADAHTVFAAAAVRTERILLGSAIVPTWPRHPVFLAQQVQALESLAPGRIRVGVGPSTAAAMRPFGVAFRRPLAQLREYVVALRALLHDGEVDVQGEFVQARARLGRTYATPVMASALQPRAFELCGEVADGALSWVCPPRYLEEVALPAIARGAARAGRTPPPLVMHAPICISDDPAEVREIAQRQIGMYPRFQFYRDMFAAAGHPDAADGLSPALVDDLVIHGSVERVAERLRGLLERGMGEVMALPLVAGMSDPAAGQRRAFEAVALAAAEGA